MLILADPGRAHDPEVMSARALQAEQPQERAALRAEPARSETVSIARLSGLRREIEQLEAQLRALPTRELQRIDDLEAHAQALTGQRDRLAERLAALPAPRRRLGRTHDEHAVERTYLQTAHEGTDRELGVVHTQRGILTRELGDPVEVRAERDGLQEALRDLTREQTELRDQLAEREIEQPSRWARQALGERPSQSAARRVWEQSVSKVARYRVQYELADPSDALGPQPEQHERQRDWEHARKAVERCQQRLGREVTIERGTGWNIGW